MDSVSLELIESHRRKLESEIANMIMIEINHQASQEIGARVGARKLYVKYIASLCSQLAPYCLANVFSFFSGSLTELKLVGNLISFLPRAIKFKHIGILCFFIVVHQLNFIPNFYLDFISNRINWRRLEEQWKYLCLFGKMQTLHHDIELFPSSVLFITTLLGFDGNKRKPKTSLTRKTFAVVLRTENKRQRWRITEKSEGENQWKW